MFAVSVFVVVVVLLCCTCYFAASESLTGNKSAIHLLIHFSVINLILFALVCCFFNLVFFVCVTQKALTGNKSGEHLFGSDPRSGICGRRNRRSPSQGGVPLDR